jgi:hypothetical protein
MAWMRAEMLDPRREARSLRTDVGRLVVSTVDTPDAGYETALIDRQGAHPVQRYASAAEAHRGHDEWVARAPELDQVLELGLPDFREDDRQIALDPFDPSSPEVES